MASMVTIAKASLISHRSTSLADQPVFSISEEIASTGARVNSAGSRLALAWAIIFAIGLRPCAFTADSLARIRALAPSDMELAFAAVIVPSLAKAGRNDGILSTRPLWGCSSSTTVTTSRRVLTSTAAVSACRRPCSMAFFARVRL